MELRARDHVSLLTAVLSTVALAAVFGAAGGFVPSGVVPDPGDAVLAAIPHFNAAISAVAIVTISLGWRSIRRGDVTRHRLLMGASFALFGLFLVGYLWRLSVVGTAPFPGPDAYYLYLYLPTLVVHVSLAVLCIPLLFYTLLVGVTHPVGDIYGTKHRTIGRIAAPLWIVSFAMGIGVYVMLHYVF